MPEPYDTLIIGAGFSGLAAGIRLAYYDKRVCILERHTTIGGLNSFYRLRGRNYDVGLHAVTNYAPPDAKKGPLRRILRQLRLSWDELHLAPQRESTVVFPGCELRFSNDFELLRTQVAENFPAQNDRFARLVETVERFDPADFGRRRDSARAVLAGHLTDPLLVEMILCPILFYSSATPHDLDFGLFAIMFQSIFLEGLARPWEGVRVLLKSLTRRFKSLGGELRLRSGVRSIRADGSRAVAVELDDGRLLEARRIVSSAGAAETMRLCSDGADPAGATPRHQPGEISFFETIAVLDCEPAELGFDRTIVFFSDRPRLRYERPAEPIDPSAGIVCSPNNFAYEKPLADGRVRVTALADPHFWLHLAEDDYRRAKAEFTARILQSAERFVPGLASHSIDVDSFTPRTIRHFTGHIHGCVYGAPEKLPDGRTHLENLYLCGTDQGLLGIIGSMLSGITIANRYCLP